MYFSGKINLSKNVPNSEGHINTLDTQTTLYLYTQNFMPDLVVKLDFGLAVNLAS